MNRYGDKRSKAGGKMAFAALLIISMAMIQCFLFRASPAYSEVVEKIVAVVGGDIITLYDLDRAMAPRLDEIRRSPLKEQKYKEVRSQVLETLIDNMLLNQAVEDAKITVTNDDLARAIRNVLATNHITAETLKAELAEKGISFESYKEDLRKNIKRMKFINQEISSRVKISDQDLRDYYEKHMEQFGVHQSAHIAQIVLPFDQNTTKEKALEMKNKASEIVRQARSGTSFASLAKQYSKGLNAENGGDLGIVDPSKLLPEVSAALEKMRTGQISDPIISPAGIQIIHLIDRAQATRDDFEKMRERIYEKMYDQRVKEELDQYLSELKKKAYVEIRD